MPKDPFVPEEPCDPEELPFVFENAPLPPDAPCDPEVESFVVVACCVAEADPNVPEEFCVSEEDPSVAGASFAGEATPTAIGFFGVVNVGVVGLDGWPRCDFAGGDGFELEEGVVGEGLFSFAFFIVFPVGLQIKATHRLGA